MAGAKCFKVTLLMLLGVVSSTVVALSRDLTLDHRWSLNDEFQHRGKLVHLPGTGYSVENSEEASLYIQNAQADPSALYQIRVCDDEQTCFSTIIKQCLMLESRLNDLIELHTDANNVIIGLSLFTKQSVCTGNQSNRSGMTLHTRVEVTAPHSAPVPDTQTYVKKLEQEKKRKAEGGTEDNRSFFAKYWMYIVPLFLFAMMASKQEEGGE